MAALTAQTAVLTALLYYWGWAEGQAYFGYFGVSTSMLDLGTTDYVLRSVAVAVPPLLAAVCIIGLAAVVLSPVWLAVTTWPPPQVRVVLLGLEAVAGLLALAGALSFVLGYTWRLPPAGRPLLLALAVAVISGAIWLGTRTQVWTLRVPWVAMSMALTIAALAIFWSWTLYARDTGLSRAKHVVDQLERRTAIALYAERRLAISGPGITVIDISTSESAYRFRYDGLRLLAKAQGRWFLLPREWHSGRDPVFVLRDDPDIRVDLVAAH